MSQSHQLFRDTGIKVVAAIVGLAGLAVVGTTTAHAVTMAPAAPAVVAQQGEAVDPPTGEVKVGLMRHLYNNYTSRAAAERAIPTLRDLAIAAGVVLLDYWIEWSDAQRAWQLLYTYR